MLVRYLSVFAAVAAVTGAASVSQVASQTAPSLDFEAFKAKVEPTFLERREGHVRCYVCHSENNNGLHLERLSPGATTWNDEQSRKNFQATTNMVNLSDVEASPLLTYPLAESAGGNHFHPGGKHWESKSEKEWQILSEWAHGKKANP